MISLTILTSEYLSTNIQIIISAKSLLFLFSSLTFCLYSLGIPQELPREKCEVQTNPAGVVWWHGAVGWGSGRGHQARTMDWERKTVEKVGRSLNQNSNWPSQLKVNMHLFPTPIHPLYNKSFSSNFVMGRLELDWKSSFRYTPTEEPVRIKYKVQIDTVY